MAGATSRPFARTVARVRGKQLALRGVHGQSSLAFAAAFRFRSIHALDADLLAVQPQCVPVDDAIRSFPTAADGHRPCRGSDLDDLCAIRLGSERKNAGQGSGGNWQIPIPGGVARGHKAERHQDAQLTHQPLQKRSATAPSPGPAMEPRRLEIVDLCRHASHRCRDGRARSACVRLTRKIKCCPILHGDQRMRAGCIASFWRRSRLAWLR